MHTVFAPHEETLNSNVNITIPETVNQTCRLGDALFCFSQPSLFAVADVSSADHTILLVRIFVSSMISFIRIEKLIQRRSQHERFMLILKKREGRREKAVIVKSHLKNRLTKKRKKKHERTGRRQC